MKEIERLKKHLERAYAEVSKLKVSGDVVDTVYEIREALRQAYRVAGMVEEAPSTTESPRHASGAALPPLTRGALDEDRDGEEDRDEEVDADAAAADEV